MAFLIAAGLPCFGPAWADSSTAPFERYGKSQGLTNPNMSCVGQDARGFIWLCTQNGLFRFDGVRFERWGESLGVNDNVVYWLEADPQGRLWVSTAADLLRQTDDGRFEPVLPAPLSQIQYGRSIVFLSDQRLMYAARGRVHLIEQAGGRWTAKPLFDESQRRAEPGLDDVHVFAQAPDGAVWMGCGQRLCEWRDATLRVWSTDDGVPAQAWRELLFDREGGLWARSHSDLVVRRAGAGRFEPRTPPKAQIVEARQFAPMAEDPQGRILTRVEGGLARWSQGRWELLNDIVEPSNGLIAALLVDREGAIWLGRQSHSLERWRGYALWDGYGRDQGLDGAIWALARDLQGDLIVGTGYGCRRLPAGERRFVPCGFEGLPEEETMLLARGPDGSLYIGPQTSDTGLTVFKVAPGQRKALPVATVDRGYAMRVDAANRLWIASSVRSAVVDPPDPAQPTKPPQLHWLDIGGPVQAQDVAVAPDGSAWFAEERDLVIARGRDLKRYKVEGLGSGTGMNSITIGADGRAWVATSGRVAELRIEGQRGQLRWLDTPLLNDKRLVLLRTDPTGRLWAGSDMGLVAKDGGQWRHIEHADGLVWDDIDSESFLTDSDGSIWFGTSAGLSHLIDPAALWRPRRLEIVLTEAHYGRQSIHAPDGRPVSLPWASDAALAVRFGALSPSLASGVGFRYRIVGLSDEWFETRIAEVRVPSLQPGAYQLEAQVVHAGRALASDVLTLPFVVTPPWWRSAVFRVLMLAAACGAVASAWRWRARVLQRRQRELERLLERATRDTLTGLWNRAAILDLLSAEIDKARAGDLPLAVAVIDIDHFKQVNDTHGHLGGDEVLRTLGRELAQGARQSDLLGRYGGEELLLVMPGLPRTEPSGPVERLRQLVGECRCVFDGKTIQVTASLGVQWWSPSVPDAQTLIAGADEALYAAKRAGRNRVVYAKPEQAHAAARDSVPG